MLRTFLYSDGERQRGILKMLTYKYILCALFIMCISSSAQLPIPSKSLIKNIKQDFAERAEDTVAIDGFFGVASGSGEQEDICSSLNITDQVNTLQAIGSSCRKTLVFDDCCQPLWLQMKTSGIYPLQATLNKLAYCDMENHGGGWIMLMRRETGKRSFDRNWIRYERGFGKLDKEFWIGLIAMHRLSLLPGGLEMRMDLRHDNGSKYYLHYDHFYIAGEESQYAITVSGYDNNSNLTDGLSYSNDAPFGTRDRKTYVDSSVDCAKICKGGWWYKECYRGGNLNYWWDDPFQQKGIPWEFDLVTLVSFTFMEMKVRPKSWHCGNRHQLDQLHTDIAFLQRIYPNLLDDGDEDDEGSKEKVLPLQPSQ